MSWIKKRKKVDDRVEAKFQTVVELIRDLDKAEFNRLKDGMQLVWEGYRKVSQAKTSLEKEIDDIEKTEKILEHENARG